jgi:hypothetical protein
MVQVERAQRLFEADHEAVRADVARQVGIEMRPQRAQRHHDRVMLLLGVLDRGLEQRRRVILVVHLVDEIAGRQPVVQHVLFQVRPLRSVVGAPHLVHPQMQLQVRIGAREGREAVLQIGIVAQRQVGDEQDLVRFLQQIGRNER